jgi:hypothetical protein
MDERMTRLLPTLSTRLSNVRLSPVYKLASS